jgi:hypothetical protein
MLVSDAATRIKINILPKLIPAQRWSLPQQGFLVNVLLVVAHVVIQFILTRLVRSVFFDTSLQ